ncbi:MAG: phosphoribosylamine--glycine ligase [Gammaproteobacteria bacterium]|nr:phosphoribosylamine--glycine ligase [Gammaproteobacteria bacterium]
MRTAKVLVIGGGGREHALAWKLAASPQVATVLVAPGNAGTAREARCENRPVAADDLDALLALARDEDVALTVVGPEQPLAAGIVDRFHSAGLAAFGPTRAAAAIEASKAFCKDFLVRHRIPTGGYAVFDAVAAALAYLDTRPLPIVVKADGLAAGKGVVVATTPIQAQQAVRQMLGGSGGRVVIEDFLAGEEASFIVLANGTDYLCLPGSQDHKRVGDGDTGPNTGGMGAISPAAVITDATEARVRTEIIEPTLAGLAAEGRSFTGFLYAGLMIDAESQPRVLEFNARLGDPETQPLMMRLESDLYAALAAASHGRLREASLRWRPQAALGVVMAAAGYPGTPRLGDPIQGLPQTEDDALKVFHAGTRLDGERVLTSGGRVLCVTALGADLARAREVAYAAVGRIDFSGAVYRRDIGARALAKQACIAA